ncbi:lysozyme inhibitor LprI family protein [Pseudomonas syringae]|uniref:lysozyme inhibitor LprI family protein n=1 Tax=Pseudomonas syringae TaxID=317 RepID=UPI0003F57463|nr:lysozyme inhibitor LprI family protein [Pseudomonas syringae]
MKKIAIVLMAVVFPLGAHAAGCAKPRNAFDQVYCAGNLFSQSDRDLNQEYTALRKHLNSTQQSSLKSGQLAWIKQRDAQCSEEKPSGYFVNLDCAVDMTQSRLAFLKERERECTSTGCVESKLGE